MPDAAPPDAQARDTAVPDGALRPLPRLERRDHPECSPLAGAAFDPEAPPATDFFKTCGQDLPRPDRAYTWVAPKRGLYLFGAFSDSDDDAAGTLELRRGDCVLTAEEGATEEATQAPICAGSRPTEDGSQTEQVLLLEQGDIITLIAEGDDFYHTLDPVELRRQSLVPRVARVDCPGAELIVDEDWEDIERLPAELPLAAELVLRVGDRHLRGLSCSTAGFGRQVGVTWTAPMDGSYRFSLREDVLPTGSDAISLALLRDECGGEELACARHATSVELEHYLQAGESLVLLLELADPSYDDIRVVLEVDLL